MPHLDGRLRAVAQMIRSPVHADIGSDHGHLLKALLAAGRIGRGIAVENKRQPHANSIATLSGVAADVRFANGLAGLDAGECDSLSICGMGGESIVCVLSEYPERVPAKVILQPNNHSDHVRRWGLEHKFRLVDERCVKGVRLFEVLQFLRGNGDRDPVYDGLDREAAIIFGPHIIRRSEPSFINRLINERAYYSQLNRLGDVATARMQAIERILSRSTKSVANPVADFC